MSVDAIVELVYRPFDAATWHPAAAEALKGLWVSGGRYPQRADKEVKVRSPKIGDDGVPYGAVIHKQNQDSGPYSGTSFVVFPRDDGPALVGLLVGTDGPGPDFGLLGQPGHARRCQAVAAWLNERHRRHVAWAKPDPTRWEEDAPRSLVTEESFGPHSAAFERYGKVMYLLFAPTMDRSLTAQGIAAIVDLLFNARGFVPLAAYQTEADEIRRGWFDFLLPKVEVEGISRALQVHRYVILQGPPGTGKTRALGLVANKHFPGRHVVVQFHPNTTYESFVGGLAPVPVDSVGGLAFAPREGVLLRAIAEAQAHADRPYLLAIDEVNRADLAKVLGEAIYLLEPQADPARSIELEHVYPRIRSASVTMPHNLYLLGTMNTADRSIAIVDVAVRRRFAFLDMWPRLDVVDPVVSPLAAESYERLLGLFVDGARDEAFRLVPGHSYFMGKDEQEVRARLRDALLPLLEEYLAQGYLSGFASEIRAYIEWLRSCVA